MYVLIENVFFVVVVFHILEVISLLFTLYQCCYVQNQWMKKVEKLNFRFLFSLNFLSLSLPISALRSSYFFSLYYIFFLVVFFSFLFCENKFDDIFLLIHSFIHSFNHSISLLFYLLGKIVEAGSCWHIHTHFTNS